MESVLGAVLIALALIFLVAWVVEWIRRHHRGTSGLAVTSSSEDSSLEAVAEPRGPPRWQFNVPFTVFVQVLARQLGAHLPDSRNDREKLAARAGVSMTTIEKMLHGETNATLHSLYLLCQARRIPLSRLFAEVEFQIEGSELHVS